MWTRRLKYIRYHLVIVWAFRKLSISRQNLPLKPKTVNQDNIEEIQIKLPNRKRNYNSAYGITEELCLAR